MSIKKLTVAALATVASAPLSAAVPEISGVTMAQDVTRRVTITYTLADAPAVVTVDVQTNNANGVWTSIGGEAVWNATGDVWKKVETGSHTITWRPDHSWPDHKIAAGGARAVVTAWALDNTPDYMVVDLDVDNTVRYYPSVDFLPKKSFDQVGAAITNNADYKTTKLVMRKIMAHGIEWTMGSTAAETQRRTEKGREDTHKVTLENNYYIGVFEVTQRQWKNVATNSTVTAQFPNNGDMSPMENISYNEIRNSANSATENSAYNWPANPNPSSFLGLLRTKTGLDFDLPTDAQWEFAARSGNGSGYWGNGTAVLNRDSDDNLSKLGRYKTNSGRKPVSVGSYAPSDWGLYDMHGNVWEWCLDWYEVDATSNGGRVNIDSEHPEKTLSGASGDKRLIRGGSFGDVASSCRSALRTGNFPYTRGNSIGFRVVCTAGLR